MPLLTTGVGKYAVAGGGTTTWNPSDNSGMTLSGGNLTTSVVGGAGATVRAIASASSGKYYWEITSSSAAPDSVLGIANSGTSLSGTYTIGFVADTAGAYINGQLQVEAVLVLTGDSFGIAGSVIGIAVDLDNDKFWFRVSTVGNEWNNDVIGNQNPASNIGGASISGVAMPVHPAINMNGTGSFTTNFGGSSYVNTPPAGFGNW